MEKEKSKENKEEFDSNALAIQYGKNYNIPRRKKESDYDYKSRVAGELRSQGHLIEAHEASSGRRYDDPEQSNINGPMTGIFGALAKALKGVEYSPNDPERQIGDDICAGILVQHQRKDDGLENIFKVFGVEGGMDIIEALSGRNKK